MYVIQTKTGCELSSGNALSNIGYDVKIPERLMTIRRGGMWNPERQVVFSGYIFLDADNVKPEDYYRIKNTAGVINFIGGGEPSKMSEAERQYINWLWNNGAPIQPSGMCITDEGECIGVSGILKEYQGEYLSVNVRQSRVKVKIPIHGVYHKITLPIEIV